MTNDTHTHTQDTCQRISVLRATENDSKDIWEWRNDELTKQMSITTDGVSWETHSSWYEKSLVNPNRYLYLGFLDNDIKIGMCRFDVDVNTNIAEVSINLNPQQKSKKLSYQLLSQAITKFCEERNTDLVATIKKSNIGSIKCFTKSGFTFEREDNDYNYYRKTNKVEGINVRYIYSACVITTTPDISILHDPWFTEGIYDGSWFHFPKIENPLESIGDVDFIYVSHIHPDHYDIDCLKKYFERYGTKQVLIANHLPNHLAGKMRAEGIEPTVLKDKLTIGNTTVEIVAHKTGSISDIDSAIVIKYQASSTKQHCVVNANDIIFDEDMRRNLKTVANEVDILLCGYTGAGPYPQTYFNSSDNQLNVEANNKKMAFFERYKTLVKAIDAKVNIPFAGKYILGGKLVGLNDFRGVADPVEVLEFDEKAVVLADNGGEINTSNLIPNHIRTNKYDEREKIKRIEEIKTMRMDYERLIASEEIGQLPLKRLLFSASRNAVSKSECDEDYYFCIRLPNEQVAVINANKNESKSLSFAEKSTPLPTPRSEIFIDPRYLFGLLTNVYHWNNAEVGSQYDTRRTPNSLNRKAQAFLNYLAI